MVFWYSAIAYISALLFVLLVRTAHGAAPEHDEPVEYTGSLWHWQWDILPLPLCLIIVAYQSKIDASFQSKFAACFAITILMVCYMLEYGKTDVCSSHTHFKHKTQYLTVINLFIQRQLRL